MSGVCATETEFLKVIMWWDKPLFLKKKPPGFYQVYSHYTTNNKASILALVKSPLIA